MTTSHGCLRGCRELSGLFVAQVRPFQDPGTDHAQLGVRRASAFACPKDRKTPAIDRRWLANMTYVQFPIIRQGTTPRTSGSVVQPS